MKPDLDELERRLQESTDPASWTHDREDKRCDCHEPTIYLMDFDECEMLTEDEYDFAIEAVRALPYLLACARYVEAAQRAARNDYHCPACGVGLDYCPADCPGRKVREMEDRR